MSHLSMRYILVLSLFVSSLSSAEERNRRSGSDDARDALGYFGACAGIILLTSAYFVITSHNRQDNTPNIIAEYAEARAGVQTKTTEAYEKMDKAERKALLQKWYEETDSELSFAQRIGKEFELHPHVQAMITQTISGWLNDKDIPHTYKARKAATAFNIFRDATAYVAIDEKLLQDFREARHLSGMAILLPLIDLMSDQEEEAIDEAQAVVYKSIFEKAWDANTAKFHKEKIAVLAKTRIVFDWKLQ